jgi:hypothetical protein
MKFITQFASLMCWPRLPNSQVWRVYLSNFICFFNVWSFILFYFFTLLQYWIGWEMKFMVYFCLLSIKLSWSQINVFFLGRCLILQVSIFIIKIIYKNNKVIKPIEIHDPGHKVTEVDSIWHRLNILKNNYRLKVFLKVISYF